MNNNLIRSQISDCQNRFELNMNNNQPSTSAGHPLAGRESSSAQNPAINSRINRKVLPEDTYDRFARSLYGTAKMCHENKDDNETTKRKILEAYSAELSRLNDELKKKLQSGSGRP